MTISSGPALGRRSLLGSALWGTLGLAGCGSASSGGGAGAAPNTNPTTLAPSTPTTTPASSGGFTELEKTYDARLGVYALDTGSGRSVEHRSGERFALCSTGKVLAVGLVLKKRGLDGLTRKIAYSRGDLVDGSPITGKETSMSLGDLCTAALRFSDNTAMNLLLEDVGGPRAVTKFVRTLGDTTTRLDRTEPDLNAAVPGDRRDTTTAQMIGTDLFALINGDTLTEVARRQLREWMLGNATGDRRIRAAVPKGWKVADKTGTGAYGTANDVALLYPKGNRAPIVLAVLSRRDTQNAEYDEQLLADATTAALTALRS